MSKKVLVILMVLGGLVCSRAAMSATVYVNGSNVSGTEDGSLAYSYNTIQEGVNVGITGDTVSVAAGTYTEAVYINKEIALLGAGSNSTTINAAGLGVANTVTFDGTSTNGAQISGFRITGATTVDSNVTAGSGIYCKNGANPLITTNIILKNAWNGIYCNYSSPIIINNDIVMEIGDGFTFS